MKIPHYVKILPSIVLCLVIVGCDASSTQNNTSLTQLPLTSKRVIDMSNVQITPEFKSMAKELAPRYLYLTESTDISYIDDITKYKDKVNINLYTVLQQDAIPYTDTVYDLKKDTPETVPNDSEIIDETQILDTEGNPYPYPMTYYYSSHEEYLDFRNSLPDNQLEDYDREFEEEIANYSEEEKAYYIAQRECLPPPPYARPAKDDPNMPASFSSEDLEIYTEDQLQVIADFEHQQRELKLVSEVYYQDMVVLRYKNVRGDSYTVHIYRDSNNGILDIKVANKYVVQ